MHAVPTSYRPMTQQTRHVETMMLQCRASVADVAPALKHHCLNASCLLRTQQTQNMCTAPIQRWPNVGAVQRLRRWSSTAQTLHKCPMIAGKTCEIKKYIANHVKN